MIYDMIVIGGGPAGYTAALYAARAGLKTLVLEKLSAGGQMALTSWVDNYPGFPEGVGGFDLGKRMRQGAERFGAETRLAEVTRLDSTAAHRAVETSEGTFYGKTIVLATGAEPRELGVPGERELVGRGISYCAQCDGMFYRGKTVAVVGGGNSAAGEALLLSRLAEKVILIHRRDSLRAEKASAEALRSAPNVEFCWNSQVTDFLFDEKFRGLRVKNLHTGEERTISCDGLFVSIGRKPSSDLAAGQLDLDEGGYVIAGEDTRTNIPGIYAAGDVRAKSLRQIVTATADGAMAAHQAEEYLNTK